MQYGIFLGNKRVNLGPWFQKADAESVRQGMNLGDRYSVRALCPNHSWRPADDCDETHLIR